MPTTITPIGLKTFIETNLVDYLGTYTHPSGTLPAIALLPHPQLGFYFPPDGWTVTGIEAVIIRPVASPNNSQQLISGDLAINYAWKIALKQHSISGDLYGAADALMIALTQEYNIQSDMGGYVPPDEKNLIPASVVVSILDPIVVVV